MKNISLPDHVYDRLKKISKDESHKSIGETVDFLLDEFEINGVVIIPDAIRELNEEEI